MFMGSKYPKPKKWKKKVIGQQQHIASLHAVLLDLKLNTDEKRDCFFYEDLGSYSTCMRVNTLLHLSQHTENQHGWPHT